MDDFQQRMNAIRERFAARLPERLDVIERGLSLNGDSTQPIADMHRSVHELSGLSATLGYVHLGETARAMEGLILPAVRGQRPLTPNEREKLNQYMLELRFSAKNEGGEPQHDNEAASGGRRGAPDGIQSHLSGSGANAARG